jgi:hypothetical protein
MDRAEESERHGERGCETRRDLEAPAGDPNPLRRARRAWGAERPSREADTQSQARERGKRGSHKGTDSGADHAADKRQCASAADSRSSTQAQDLILVALAQGVMSESMKGVRSARQPIDAERERPRQLWRVWMAEAQDGDAVRKRTAVP